MPMIHALQTAAATLVWFFENDQIARWTALLIWIAVSSMLAIPAYRRLFGKPLYVDDLLFSAWLLTLNRVCFSVQSLFHNDSFADLTRWTGIAAALFYGYVVSSYIRPAWLAR